MAKTISSIAQEITDALNSKGLLSSKNGNSISITLKGPIQLSAWTSCLSRGKPRTYELEIDDVYRIEKYALCRFSINGTDFTYEIDNEINKEDLATSLSGIISGDGIIRAFSVNDKIFIEVNNNTTVTVDPKDDVSFILSGDIIESSRFALSNNGQIIDFTINNEATLSEIADAFSSNLSLDFSGSLLDGVDDHIVIRSESETIPLSPVDTTTITFSGNLSKTDNVKFVINENTYEIKVIDIVPVDYNSGSVDTFDTPQDWTINSGWSISEGKASAV